MSKITASTDLDKVKPEDLPRYLTLFAQDVAKQLSNSLDFATNFNGKEISVTFTAANTEVATAHTLGRAPSKYVVTSASTALSVYSGATSNSSDTIYLKSSAIGVATLLIY